MDNAWVDTYLEALLSSGLSGEYVGQRKSAHNATLSDPDKDIYAQYYVQQILNTDEEGIVSAWQKAQAGGPTVPKDVRLEYLAWRVWSMHQRRKRMRRVEEDTPATSPKSYDGGSVTPLTMSYESRSGMYMDRHLNKSPMTPSLLGPQGDSVSSSPRASAMPALATPLRVKVDKTVRIKVDDSALVSPSPMSAQATPAPQTLFAGRVDKLYLILVSIHGLVRGEKMELGKDADTGGQVKYVVELAKNLALHPMVHRVDLLTRLIEDPKVDASYGQQEEMLLKGDGEVGGAFITRIKCGDPKVYLPKEELWPHVREFADNSMVFIKGMLSKMTAAGEPCDLYAVHGHYADGGEVAALISHTLDVEMVLTGHSLGRNKLDHLLKSGTVTRKQIEETYKISRRIEAEERALDAAIMVLSSTQQEIDLQWGLYDGWDPKVANAVRYRRRVGRHMPNMVVIPPGLQFSTYKVELPSDPMQLYIDYREAMMDKSLTMFSNVQNQNALATAQYPTGPSDLSELDGSPPPPAKHAGPGGLAQAFNNVSLSARVGSTGGGWMKRTGSHMSLGRTESEGAGRITRNTSHVSLGNADADGHSRAGPSVPGSVVGTEDAPIPPIWKEIQRFLRVPYKPVVLAMSRPDAKKNIVTLVKAFGSNPVLRNLANLVLIMGNRDNIDSLNKGSQSVLMQVLKLIDAHDLYGSVAYPKSHEQSDISDIYHFVTRTRGVFTNIALQEPFGLTLIEAAVHGAPIVATKHGGPVDIIRTLKNGKLVEPTNVEEVSKAIVDVLRDSVMWDSCSRNGINNILAYSWPSHCIQYLECIEKEKLRLSRRDKGHRHSWDGNEMPERRDMEKSGANSPTSGRLLAQSILQGDHNHMQSITPEALERISCPVNIAANVPDTAPPALSTATSGVNDDLVTAAVRAVEPLPSVTLATRERLAFALLDNSNDIEHLVTVLTAAAKAKGAAVGLGLLTVFTFPEVLDLLASKGFDAKQLDFVVVNNGAYVMCVNSNGDWIGDEAWDHKVTAHWDKQLVMRTLTRMTMSRSRSEKEDEAGSVMKVLQRESATETDDGSGPMHCLLHLSAEEKSAMAAVDNHTLLGYVRKRVRSLGIRCNLTLQLVPRSGENAISVLHATPLRASRAMALRHIFMAHGIDMPKSTFLCTPATITNTDSGTLLGALCSDMDSLIQGAYQVLIVPPSRSVEKEIEVKKDATAFERLKVSLAPYTPERVRVVSDAKEASQHI